LSYRLTISINVCFDSSAIVQTSFCSPEKLVSNGLVSSYSHGLNWIKYITSLSSRGRCDGVSWSDGRPWHIVAVSDCASSRPLPAVRAAAVPTLCRLPLVTSTVSETETPPVRRRRLSHHCIVTPLPWPYSTVGHRCRRQVVVRRSPGLSSPSPELRISYFSPLTVSLLFWQFCCLTWRVSVELFVNWLIVHWTIVVKELFPFCGVQSKDIFSCSWLNRLFNLTNCWFHVYCLILFYLCSIVSKSELLRVALNVLASTAFNFAEWLLIIRALRYDTTIAEFPLDLSDFDSVSLINYIAELFNRLYSSVKSE